MKAQVAVQQPHSPGAGSICAMVLPDAALAGSSSQLPSLKGKETAAVGARQYILSHDPKRNLSRVSFVIRKIKGRKKKQSEEKGATWRQKLPRTFALLICETSFLEPPRVPGSSSPSAQKPIVHSCRT